MEHSMNFFVSLSLITFKVNKMLDNILNLVKDTVAHSISGNNNIPEEKKYQAVETTTHAVTDGLKNNLNLGNMSNLMNLFNGGSSATSNPITNNIIGTVTSELVQKVGLSQSVANIISTSVVPLVMSVISGKVNDPNEKGFNIESLIHTFSGSENNGNSILGSLGKLFGK